MKTSALKSLRALLVVGVLVCSARLPARDSSITVKALKERTERGSLSDRREFVRGDSGKWNDAATLQHAPPLEQKPKSMSLDDWADQLSERKIVTTSADENWILFRTRQLDDNDRVWVEKIERRGNEFTIVLHEAIWQGHYFKTFTYYEVTAVKLGRLPAGDYTAKWIVQPFTFKQLEKPREAIRDYQTNWPKDEQPSGGKPLELAVAFTVAAP